MLTSKLTLKQIKKARAHYHFMKRLDEAFLRLPVDKIGDARKFFVDLKKLWDEADTYVTAWLSKTVEPAIRDAFEYFLTKLNI